MTFGGDDARAVLRRSCEMKQSKRLAISSCGWPSLKDAGQRIEQSAPCRERSAQGALFHRFKERIERIDYRMEKRSVPFRIPYGSESLDHGMAAWRARAKDFVDSLPPPGQADLPKQRIRDPRRDADHFSRKR